MNAMLKKTLNGFLLSKETWVFVFLTLLCLGTLFSFVDLTPQVDYDAFFSNEDPNYKADIEISKLFPRNDAQIIISVAGDIRSKSYQDRIKKFGSLLLDLDHITDVKSITRGPRSFQDAVESPFWSQLLIAEKNRASNLIVTFSPDTTQGQLRDIIPKIENLKNVLQSQDFRIYISGFPYIVDLIRRHLDSDLGTFSLLALIIFGLFIIFIFHSWRILIGMTIACFNAAALTLMLSNLLHTKIGILTANIITIVFVLTLSHIVFLTFNWKHLDHITDSREAGDKAIKMTFPASFWAMATTLLGFLSLLYVQAKPIKELGAAGSIGTIISFLMAYCVYPSFLKLKGPHHDKKDETLEHMYKGSFAFFEKNKWVVLITLIGIILLTAPDLTHINTDPSLISFFSKKSKITQGLEYIDTHGGSNPMVAVVDSPDGTPLYTKKNLQNLWNIQIQLENHPDVGTVISLPLLVKEARRSNFFSFILSNRRLMDIISGPQYDRVGQGFVTKNYKHSLFLLRMNEEKRDANRLKIVSQLKKIIRQNHMVPYLIGGIYPLQGHLSKHVVDSLIFGLSRLLVVFFIIAFISSHSFKTGLGMTFSICLVPLCILGVFGTFRIPLDIIAAPASNIAISIGIDAMLHMVHTYRRIKKEHPENHLVWQIVRRKLWEPVMTSMFLVATGFGIFFFSNFPATQRFGASISLGTIIAGFTALFVFPLLAKQNGNSTDKKEDSAKRKETPEEKSARFFIPDHQKN